MQHASAYAEALAPVAACMLEEARISAGQRVLDVGSGGGDMALLAADLAGQSGYVLATDVSLAKMAGLAARIGSMPTPPVIAIHECAAEDLASESGTFDVALARNCVMYFRDLGRALENVRRALRPGGRLVVSVYGPLEHEPFHAIPVAAVSSRHSPIEAAPDYVQAFKVDAADVQAALARAGFTDVRARVVEVRRSYASLDAALAEMRRSPSLGELMAALPTQQRDDTWTDIADGFRQFEGAAEFHIPGEQVVITGRA